MVFFAALIVGTFRGRPDFLWSEDGLFLDAERSVLEPYAGYRHIPISILGRLIATFIPYQWWDWAATITATAVIAAIATMIYTQGEGTARWLVPSWLVLQSVSFEALGNLPNIHWWLLIGAIWASLVPSTPGVFVTALSSLSNPATLLLVPLNMKQPRMLAASTLSLAHLGLSDFALNTDAIIWGPLMFGRSALSILVGERTIVWLASGWILIVFMIVGALVAWGLRGQPVLLTFAVIFSILGPLLRDMSFEDMTTWHLMYFTRFLLVPAFILIVAWVRTLDALPPRFLHVTVAILLVAFASQVRHRDHIPKWEPMQCGEYAIAPFSAGYSATVPCEGS